MTDTVPELSCVECGKKLKPGQGRLMAPPPTRKDHRRIRVCSKRCRDKQGRTRGWDLGYTEDR